MQNTFLWKDDIFKLKKMKITGTDPNAICDVIQHESELQRKITRRGIKFNLQRTDHQKFREDRMDKMYEESSKEIYKICEEYYKEQERKEKIRNGKKIKKKY